MSRVVVALFLFAPAASLAQAPAYRHAAAVDAVAQAAFEKQGLVGLAVAVIDGEVAWAKGYGFADREAKTPVDPATTSFRWASISKSVTAVAALQLADAGKLDLDADVRTYVPEFPDKGARITARMLLCHRAGIVHYTNGRVVRTERRYADPHPFADVVTALDTFKDSPLVNPPGERFSYTTHGYILLSAVVERAGKKRFADQVQDRIAGPLGMATFRPDYEWEDVPNRAAGYLRKGDAVERRPDDEAAAVSWKLGGGGYTSAVTDLARFGVGLIRHKLVSADTERRMWAAQSPAGEAGARPYGLGFALAERPGGATWVGHSGSQAKTRTQLWIDPAGKTGVAVMTNSEWGTPAAVAADVMAAIR